MAHFDAAEKPVSDRAPLVGTPAVSASAPVVGVVYDVQPQHGVPVVMPMTYWQTGLCGWTDDMNGSCEALWCNRCQMSRQYNLLQHNEAGFDHPTFWLSLIADVALGAPVTAIVLNFFLRQRVRQRYAIASSALDDALLALCCTPCSTAQVSREMSIRGEFPGACCYTLPYSLPAPPQTVVMSEQPIQARQVAAAPVAAAPADL